MLCTIYVAAPYRPTQLSGTHVSDAVSEYLTSGHGDIDNRPASPAARIRTATVAAATAVVRMTAFRFFIPDVEYLKDPEGLVGYVEEKVKLGHICLYCNGKGKTFHTYRALQQVCAHNRDA